MGNPQKSRYDCMVDGCTRSVKSGHAIHRTSPKGELFEGMCTEHYSGTPDPIAVAIEERNQRLALSAPPEETTA